MTHEAKPVIAHAHTPIPHGYGRIRLHAVVPTGQLGSFAAFSQVEIWIDQTPLMTFWGQTLIDVPAGFHSIRLRAAGARRESPGFAGMTVHPGTESPLYYRPSLLGGVAAVSQQPLSKGGVETWILWVLIPVLAIGFLGVVLWAVHDITTEENKRDKQQEKEERKERQKQYWDCVADLEPGDSPSQCDHIKE